jgi:hypothetical protein
MEIGSTADPKKPEGSKVISVKAVEALRVARG